MNNCEICGNPLYGQVATGLRCHAECVATAYSKLLDRYNAAVEVCRLALEVILRHDTGETGCVDCLSALESYTGEDNLTDPDGVQGIGDRLRQVIFYNAQPETTIPSGQIVCAGNTEAK